MAGQDTRKIHRGCRGDQFARKLLPTDRLRSEKGALDDLEMTIGHAVFKALFAPRFMPVERRDEVNLPASSAAGLSLGADAGR